MASFGCLTGNLLIISVFCCSLFFQVGVSSHCPARTDRDVRCKRPCRVDSDCGSSKKTCKCDGPCGMSCVRKGLKCRHDYYDVPKRGRRVINGLKHGDTVVYSCNEGYKLYGTPMITCGGIRKWKPWDKGTPACKRGCENPGAPRNGLRIGADFEVGKRVRFRCNPGYKLKGPRYSTCNDNLKWSRILPSCEVSICAVPRLPGNSNIRNGEREMYIYGDRIILGCAAGYSRVGRSVMTCLLNGWSTTSFRCARKSCGHPGDLPNGVIKGTLYTFESEVTYECNPGFKLRGPYRRVCFKNQKWTGSPPVCNPMDCRSPPNLQNGRYEGYSLKYGAQRNAKCNVGYELSGSRTITCDGTRWKHDGEVSKCTACLAPSRIDNGEVEQKGNQAIYKCYADYRLIGDNVRHCRRGAWEGKIPRCIRKKCPSIAAPANSEVTPKQRYGFDEGSTVSFRCHNGYQIEGSSTLSCGNGGKWSGDAPKCVRDEVLNNDNIARLYVGCFEDKIPRALPFHKYMGRDGVKDSYIVECIKNCREKKAEYAGLQNHRECFCGINHNKYGKKDENDCDRTCDDGHGFCGGHWRNSIYKTKCLLPEDPVNGSAFYSDYKKGDKGNYKCNKGFKLEGEGQKCNGLFWYGSVPICKEERCPQEFATPKLQILTSSFLEGANGVFHCTDNYLIQGDKQGICRDRVWTGSRTCLAPCLPTLGDNYEYDSKDHYFHNSIAKEQCHGNNRRQLYRCSNGSWIFEKELSCDVRAKTCDSPPRIPNGKAKKQGNNASYRCERGFNLLGKAVLHCENGKWIGEVPSCKSSKTCTTNVSSPLRALNSFVRNLNPQTFACNNGYELVGSAIIFCHTGRLTHRLPTCEPKRCNTCPETRSFEDLCSSHATVFIGEVTETDDGFTDIEIKHHLKTSGNRPLSMPSSYRVSKKTSRCRCPTIQERKEYVFFSQDTLGMVTTVTHILPIEIERRRHGQLAYFCK